MADHPSVTIALLASGKTLRIAPQGQSMYPLLNGRTDIVVVAPLRGMPKKNALALYRDDQGQLVVHRVIAVDPETETCDMLGDGNVAVEHGIPVKRVYGVVTQIQKRSVQFSTKNVFYRLYVHVWRFLYRKRQPAIAWLRKLQKLGGHKK